MMDKAVRQPQLDGDAATTATSPNYLVLSAHDYRTPRRASIHFITDELARRGHVRFFSLRYSRLSRLKGDARLPLDDGANRIEIRNGVECYLWRVLAHPFNTRKPWLRGAEDLWFRGYVRQAPSVLKRWIVEADVIVFESGTAVAFIAMARRLNPAARLIYRASDALNTINVADYIEREFVRMMSTLDVIALVSPKMADRIPNAANVAHIPHGIDPQLEALADPSPYGDGLHAVSLGSMLFDPQFIEVASQAFPQVTFHVIGSGTGAQPGYGSNVRVYGEMKHTLTIPYIKHATIGLAPYSSSAIPAYLADSSLKLQQYDFFALPAVCPFAVVGDYSSRFGYTPGNADQIVSAIRDALDAPRVSHRTHLDWPATVDRLLRPEEYPDVRL